MRLTVPFLLALCSVCGVTGCNEQSQHPLPEQKPQEPLTKDQMRKVEGERKSQRAEVALTRQRQAGGDTLNWALYEYMKCPAEWFQYCEQKVVEAAPSGWQVCKPYWGRIGAGKGGPTWRVRVEDYANVSFYQYANGSGNPVDQWGSNIDVYDIGMKIIRAPTTPAERAAAGCVDPGWTN